MKPQDHPTWNQGKNPSHDPGDMWKVMVLVLGSTFGLLGLMWVAVQWPGYVACVVLGAIGMLAFDMWALGETASRLGGGK